MHWCIECGVRSHRSTELSTAALMLCVAIVRTLQIVSPGPNLLSTVNGKPVFSDVTLCCGSSITFGWQVTILADLLAAGSDDKVDLFMCCVAQRAVLLHTDKVHVQVHALYI
jgi:hypothetical protein